MVMFWQTHCLPGMSDSNSEKYGIYGLKPQFMCSYSRQSDPSKSLSCAEQK